MNMHLLARPIAVVLCSLLLASLAAAQDAKLPVSLSHTGEDNTGKQFAYAIREAIRGSNGFRLTGENDAGIHVKLITIDPEQSRSSGSAWTVASITYVMTNFLPYEKGNPQTWYPIYLTSQVFTVGTQRTNDQARAVMASIDEALERYRRDSRKQ